MLGLAAQHGQCHQGVIPQAEERRPERARQRQVVPGGHQGIEQRHDVLHLGGVEQVGFFGLHAGQVQGAQCVLHGGKPVALAGQHQHLVGRRARGDLRGHPGGGLRAFAHALGFFGLVARLGQAVAPGEGVSARTTIGIRRQDGGQAQQHAGVGGFGGVVAKAAGLVLRLGGAHGVVHGGDHARGVAARVVAAQQVPAQPALHKGLCGDEHLRLGAAKAVDALLGVAHDEHAGRLLAAGAAARARIARQPGMQRLPLQWVGVLELIHQQMADAGIQAFLHPATEDGVGQHDERGALHIVHVHPAVLVLDGGKRCNQATRQPGHALLVQPRIVLAAGGEQALQFGLGLLRGGILFEVLREPVFLGHEQGPAQRVQALVQVVAGQRVDDGVGGLLGRLVGLGPQGLGTGEPALMAGIALQRIGRFAERCELGGMHLERRHRGIDHAGGIGQVELDPLGERRRQRLVRLRAAMTGHHGLVVGPQAGRGGDGLQKGRPHLAHGLGIVLQQFEAGGQPLRLQKRQRGRAQQRGKPAVEGADLHRAASLQQLAV